MLKPGSKAICVILDDEAADGSHIPSMALLKLGNVYTMAEFQDADECARRFRDQPHFAQNGGRVVTQEMPGLEFFGKRFAEQAA